MTRNSASTIAHDYHEGMDVVCMWDHQMHDKLNYLDRYKVLSVETDVLGLRLVEITARNHRNEKFPAEWFVPLWYFEGKDAPLRMDEKAMTDPQPVVKWDRYVPSFENREDTVIDQAQQFQNVPDTFAIAEVKISGKPVGQKWDGGKTNPSLLFEGVPLALALVTRTLDYGYAKYQDAHGWSRVPNAIVRYTSAGYRHLLKKLTGETHDDESGLLHDAHEIINKLFVLELRLREMSTEDRAKEMTHREPPKHD